MRKIATQFAVGAMVLGSVAFFGASGSGAATTTTVAPTTTTTAPSAPFVSGNKWLTVNVDTVVSHSAQGSCLLQNVFTQGQTVVFRMWGVDNLTGRPLLADSVNATTGAVVYMPHANVTSAIIKGLPGMKAPVRMTYNTKDGYFTYGWFTSTSTPVGIVPFKVIVTLAAKPAVYGWATAKVNGKVVKVKVIKVKAQPAHSYAYMENGAATGNGALASPSQVIIVAAPV